MEEMEKAFDSLTPELKTLESLCLASRNLVFELKQMQMAVSGMINQTTDIFNKISEYEELSNFSSRKQQGERDGQNDTVGNRLTKNLSFF